MKDQVRAFRELLSNRSFTLYAFSHHLSFMGGTMTLFAIWSQVTILTHANPMAMGLATILDVLPGVVIAPIAGLLADRMSKRYILITVHLLRAVIVALMFGSSALWQIYALAVLHSAVGAFGDPPHRALLPLLVREDQYVTMNSFMGTLNNCLQFFRPILSGLVVSVLGYKMGFAVDFFTYFIPAGVLFFALASVQDIAETRTKEDLAKSSAWSEFRQGVAYIRTEPALVYLFVFMMLFTLCMAMQSPLTMVFVSTYLTTPEHASAVLGYLFSTLGIGGLLGSLLTPYLIKRIPMFRLLLIALAFDGVVVLLFSTCTTIWFALCCFSLFGIIGSVNQIVQDTLVQSIVPEQMRGRVYGAFGPITGPLSLLSMGGGTSLASLIGTRYVFALAGFMEIAAVIVCRLLPSYTQVRISLAEKLRHLTNA